MAYFRTAKKHHPDVNKDASPTMKAAAKKKWQEAANAYEVLSDPTKRAAYDSGADGASSNSSGFGGGWSGWSGPQQQQQQQQQYQQHHDANAQTQWDNVTSDAEVVEEAINEYAEELKENASKAAAGAARGDFTEVWNFVKEHKGLVATVVVPTLLVFRFPGPAMAALRFVPQALLALLGLTLRVGGTRGVHQLWSLVGHLVMQGSKSAASELKAYTEKRKELRELRARQTRQAASERARQRASSSSSSSSNHQRSSGGARGRRSRHTPPPKR